MPTINNSIQLNVLITRPEKKAQQLACLLKQQNIACMNQPLFDYQASVNSHNNTKLLTDVDIIIFVSAAAAEFANAYLPTKSWQYQQILAVGKATKKTLLQLGIETVISPQQENSEGLLDSTLLNQRLEGKTVTIVRGNGGREHLADTLVSRGAKVSYLETYQRVWRLLTADISKQWYEQQINCIVVTSNAILEKLAALLLTQEKTSKNLTFEYYWRQQCHWLATSQRIAHKAKQLGLLKVITCGGANDEIVSATLQSLKTDLSNLIQ